MLENNNNYKILKIFLFSPNDSFRLRELSRMSKISPPSVMNYLKKFEKEELIKSYRKRDIPYYRANIENQNLNFYKRLATLYELHKSGLIEYLWDKLAPEAIILYGSYAKGEFTEESDMDIFIIGKEKRINIEDFEKKLAVKLHMLFEENPKKIHEKLKNNLCNGLVLKGYFKPY
jgi:predicted nucleotidyltransferase